MAQVVWRLWIPEGEAGTDVTVAVLRQLIEKGRENPVVRQLAVDIVATAGIVPGDAMAELRALFSWVRGRIRYEPDPVGVELVQDAISLLSSGAGDCEDMVVLLASLAEALGYPTEIVVVARDRHGNFEHVLVAANVPESVPMDVASTLEFGHEYSGYERKKIYH